MRGVLTFRARGGLARAFAWSALPLAALALAAPARADETIRAQLSTRYANPSITIDQGERVFFANDDVTTHDVTAEAPGPYRGALFSAPLTDRGRRAQVEGAEHLTTGAYPFYCSVHNFMKGTITVTGAGTPAPRTADTTRPTVRLRLLGDTLREVIRRGRLRVRASVDEPATLAVAAKLGGVTVGRGTASFDVAGTQVVSLRLTSAGRRALRKRKRAAIAVSASARDASGNSGSAQTRRSLRR